VLLFVIPLALTALVYHRITGNYFFADDFLHLFRVRNEDFPPFLLVPRGGHLLVSYNALFDLAYRLFGTHPEPYFWVALLTHLLNVGLLFSVIRLFTHSARLACFGAALWGISPQSEAAIGWFSVFGQVMVATVLLVVLRQLALVANGRPSGRYAPLLWCVLLLIACTCLYPATRRQRRHRRSAAELRERKLLGSQLFAGVRDQEQRAHLQSQAIGRLRAGFRATPCRCERGGAGERSR
jgi:hypothetical protein